MTDYLFLDVQRQPGLTVVELLGVTADQPALVLPAGHQSGRHRHHVSRLRLCQVVKPPSRALDQISYITSEHYINWLSYLF